VSQNTDQAKLHAVGNAMGWTWEAMGGNEAVCPWLAPWEAMGGNDAVCPWLAPHVPRNW
jgi:hypothetical protein